MPDRAAIQAAARSLVGRRFVMNGRATGVDCVGVIILTARKAGIVGPDYEVNGYGRQTARDEILAQFRARMVEIAPARLQPGDVVLIRDAVLPTHCGVVTFKQGQTSLVHAYGRVAVRRVVEEPLVLWQARITHAFQFPSPVGGDAP